MKKITIIGGDTRLIKVKSKLEQSGYQVDSLGLIENDTAELSTSRVIVLPVPTTKDGIYVNAPLTNKKISLEFIEENINNDQLILSCNYLFSKRKCIDYNSLDSYALLNSVPTAEGAIKIAIENTPFTLWKSKVLVIGYGRVGRVLAHRLRALGSYVTVSARKTADFAATEAFGYESIDTGNINSSPLDYDIIFNTVDAEVINRESLKNTRCRCMIDLSSKGGFDLRIAKESGITAIKAPGLPGIVAPKTAGEILAKTILDLINLYV